MPDVLAGAVIGAGAIALVLLASLLVAAGPWALDAKLVIGLRAWGGPAWLRTLAIDLTELGGGRILTLVVALAAGLLAVRRLWLTALAVIAASWSGGFAVDLLKLHVARPRPDLVAHLVPVTNLSFPSGHAAASATVYLTLAALASQVTPDRATRRYLLTAALLLVGAIGCSRVYLGVHWPSDVLAGWSFGTLWALGWWLATARVRQSIGGERD